MRIDLALVVDGAPDAVDTVFHAVYVGGLAGLAGIGGATLDFYFYDEQGALMSAVKRSKR